MRVMRRAPSNKPSPQSSTPQLFDTTRKSLTPESSSALISTLGIPQRPKPPTDSEHPSVTPATASADD